MISDYQLIYGLNRLILSLVSVVLCNIICSFFYVTPAFYLLAFVVHGRSVGGKKQLENSGVIHCLAGGHLLMSMPNSEHASCCVTFT